MSQMISIAQLQVEPCLFEFIEQEVLPETTYQSAEFWQAFSNLVNDLSPVNQSLLNKRNKLQSAIDNWHQEHQFTSETFEQYKKLLQDIGYIESEVDDFQVTTVNVDDEIAHMAGPQLVVPIMNARFALNAVNARWGSLYDALYGSDIISEADGAEKAGRYNPVRGNKVIEFAKQFLDENLPLANGSYQQAKSFSVQGEQLQITLDNDESTTLADNQWFAGYTGSNQRPSSIIIKHNALHIELCFDKQSPIGQQDKAELSDIQLESAITTIMDCEDSVAAVDGEDKVIAYRNWLGLIKGTLTETVNKNGETFTRAMRADKSYFSPDGQQQRLKAKSLMFIRNVGHLMSTPMLIDGKGKQVPEGIADAMITSLIASLDIQGQYHGNNSQQGSVYIVKPKMHGSEEVAFANQLFERVEQALALPKNTIKIGIMDEERRTSVNLKNCIYQAKERVAFINTGFLDRTGDEIHTSMYAGAMTRKNDIKLTKWIAAYEQNNVDTGIQCGLVGKAQIGKGMWPIPDQMNNMYQQKIAHLEAGANTAWVPSPTAATLHALHYHQQSVVDIQHSLTSRTPINSDTLLQIPLGDSSDYSEQEITNELDNNVQGILGYVVRWIDQGIGCSKVPDINNIGLMEDRATLRISSQHIANWLHHNVCTTEQVKASLAKMAKIVDQQNANDPHYVPMSDDLINSIAFKAASALIFEGKQQPSGYTEPLLHHYRGIKKAQM